jgi:hypothetical protein
VPLLKKGGHRVAVVDISNVSGFTGEAMERYLRNMRELEWTKNGIVLSTGSSPRGTSDWGYAAYAADSLADIENGKIQPDQKKSRANGLTTYPPNLCD